MRNILLIQRIRECRGFIILRGPFRRVNSVSAIVIIVLVYLLVCSPPALATYSIVIADQETGEIGLSTFTCLADGDLLGILPVVLVGKGAAVVQAGPDMDGVRRSLIFTHLQAGTNPQEILALLATLNGHELWQYGIVDSRGRAVTFTGSATLPWAGGVLGEMGSIVYAIEGNILAGNCVVPAMEAAVRSTPGDIPAKMMAGTVPIPDPRPTIMARNRVKTGLNEGAARVASLGGVVPPSGRA